MAVKSMLKGCKSAFWLALLCCFLGGFDALAEPSMGLARPVVHSLEDVTAQSGGRINVIEQSQEGYLWLGTANGLLRFDGYEVKVFNHQPGDPQGIAGNYLIDIVEHESGHLWLSYGNDGLASFNPKTQRFAWHTLDVTLSEHFRIGYIHQRDKHRLWLSTSEGLFSYHTITGKVDIFHLPEGHRQTQIMRLLPDDSGFWWVATVHNGLYRLDADQRQWQHWDVSAGLNDNFVLDLIQVDADHLWVMTRGGVNRLDRRGGKVTEFVSDTIPDALLRQPVARAIRDGQNNVWLSLRSGKAIFYHADSGRWRQFEAAGTGEIFADRQWQIWFGGQAGLFRINPDTMAFSLFEPQQNTQIKYTSVTAEPDGQVWVGADELYRYEHQTGQLILSSGKLNNFTIWAQSGQLIFEDRSQGLAIGEYVVANGNTRVLYRHQGQGRGELNLNDATSIGSTHYVSLTDYNVSKQTGVFALTDKPDTLKPLLTNIKPMQLLALDDATLLVLTVEQLYQVDVKTAAAKVIYQVPASGNALLCVFKDDSGQLWLCTSQAGLLKFDLTEGVLQSYPLESSIWSVTEDDEGVFWLGTGSGLVRFDPRSLRMQLLNTAMGAPNVNYGRNGTGRASDGSIWLASSKGAVRIFPDMLSKTVAPAPTVLTDFKLLNESVVVEPDNEQAVLQQTIGHTRHITLTHQDYLLSFKFATLDSTNPNDLQYGYMMEGLDPQWLYTDAANRNATYTTLPFGEYTFRVKGTDSSGRWNEGTSVRLTVLAPPWLRTEAFVLYAVVAVVMVVLYNFVRTAALRRRAKALETGIQERTKTISALLADKERLFANVSHEFRTPLTLILGPLERGIDRASDSQTGQMLGLAKANATRLLGMVDQLLDIARLDRPVETNKVHADVVQTCRFLVESFHSLVEARRIVLTLNDKVGEPLNVYMQADALEKILSNLLTNAFKYAGNDQRVTVTVERLGQYLVQIVVEDTGIGISKADQANLFERFSRLDNHSDYLPGAGIGLALVKELVEYHQGSITLQSDLGEGCRFMVVLPVADKVEQSTAQVNRALINEQVARLGNDRQVDDLAVTSPMDDNESAKPNVLIVEDNQHMRQYLTSALYEHFQLTLAEDGEQGLQLARDILPDLIISDVMMPKMDGITLTRTIKSDPVTNHIPLILLTALGDRASRVKGWQEKADEYLEKPFDVTELLARCQNLLEVRTLLRQRFARNFNEPALAEPLSDVSVHSSEGDAHQGVANQINALLEQHYQDETFDMGRFAEGMALSKRQLSRKLKTLLDMTPVEILRNYRLRKAAEMLRAGQAPGNVAFSVGFTSHSYFSQCFKAQFGCNPSEYRERG